MFKCKNKIDQNLDLIAANNKIDEQKEIIDEQQAEILRLRSLISNSVTASSFVFDFKSMRAFSVERIIRDGQPTTIIGYLLQEVENKDGTIKTQDKVREWFFNCNQEQHEKLVHEFEKAKK